MINGGPQASAFLGGKFTATSTAGVFRPAAPPVLPGLSVDSGRTVCKAERALDKQGYRTPIIDCIWGQQLSGVVARFQKDRKLPITDELDLATRKALGIQ